MIQPTNYTQDFLKTYAGLNEKQKQAVDQIEGAVLVIAGPGTGKTQILASRIAKILMDTDTQAEHILCLTYTDAGTVAMRKRLFEFIGTDAYRIAIHTFHSFCNSVIQRNQDYFGLIGLEPVSELEQIQFIHEMIDEWEQNHPLKKYTGDVYSETKRLKELYTNMKRENWSATFIVQKVDEYIAGLEYRDDFIYKTNSKHGKKGELKQAKYNEALERMTKLKAAAISFDIYQSKLKLNNRYDFDDMILWVIDAFQRSPELLIPIQEQYNYFLVDEFQDTSGSQNKILEMLINYWDTPNVFCVGDDDQSIYRFQGANVENIRQFMQQYNPGVVTLEDNYRSSQLILDASKVLISNNQKSRINPDKKLTAQNAQYADLPTKPELRCYYNSEHEAAGIAHEIEQLHKNGVQLSEIAVLYPKHRYAESIVAYLQNKSIPVHLRKSVNLLEEPLAKQIIHILTYLAAENKRAHSGEHLLYELLHFDCFRVDSIALSKLSMTVDAKRRNSDKSYSWREAMQETFLVTQPLVSSYGSIPLSQISATIEDWIKATFNLTPQQVLEKVINESGLLVKALTHADKTWYMQVLHSLFDFVKQECARHPKTTIQQLINILLLMEKEQVDIPVQRIAYANDGVQFLTVHSSKGLEFEYVFMISCNKDAWGKGRNYGFSFPDNLFEINTDDEIEERRRLFYVGMTRAKKQLVISYADKNSNEKNLEKAEFVAELEKEASVTMLNIHEHDEQLIDFKLNTYQLQKTFSSQGLFDNERVDELLENYILSVTHMNNYLKCPTSFYFNNLLRIPAPLSPYMTFGSAVHYGLEKLFDKMTKDEQHLFPSPDILVQDFKFYMRNNQEAFTEQDYLRRLEYGEMILRGYYDKYITDWNKNTLLEKKYDNIIYNGIPIKGVLDKMEMDGKKINVVDYKTGKYDNAKKKLNRPDPLKVDELKLNNKPVPLETEYGGDYWRQATFYKILIEHAPNNDLEMLSAEFDFIEPEKGTQQYHKTQLVINEEDVKLITQQITTTYHAIKNKQFANGCGEADCKWCGFVTTYYKGEIPNMNLQPNTDEDD